MSKALYFINSLGIILILLSVAVFIPTFDKSFYIREYDKYQIPESIGVSKDDLMIVTDNLLNYMKGKYPSLDVSVKINGDHRQFFNQKEKDHMVDVKNLLSSGFILRNVSIALLAATCFYTFIKRDYHVALRYTFFSMLSILIAAIILVIIISLDFDRSFTIFHEIFFNNDLWVLDPSTDLLINIVPFNFFVDIASLIAVIFTVSTTAVLVALRLLGKKLKRV